MENVKDLINYSELPCCPDLDNDPIQDYLDIRRKLTFPTNVRTPQGQNVRVEVILHTRFCRESGPMALGDLVYSTTLLPGEKVRLTTTDRRSRFSFDSESKLSYRSEQISVEQYRMTALRAFMADQSSSDTISDRASSQGKWDFHGDASGSLGFFSVGAETNARGSHSGSSTRDYLAAHKSHAEVSDRQSVSATRMAHAISVGEVSSRTHTEGETEDHFEASSREFRNLNQCHAVTYLFYRLNKTEIIRFELLAIERRVLDPNSSMPLQGNAYRSVGQLSAIHQELPANGKQRVEIEERGLQSEALYQKQLNTGLAGTVFGVNRDIADFVVSSPQNLISDEIRQRALDEVDKQLISQGLLDPETRSVSRKAQIEFGFERKSSLPTPGVIVRGCLDNCNVCEAELQTSISLDLEHKKLKNDLLRRQIELLDQSQEYRCCPCDEKDPE